MRRHQKISFLISAVLISTMLTSQNSSAAVKAGVKCLKPGATSIQSNKKFTCIKSGKKLVWNKGVSITEKNVSAHDVVINSVIKDWQNWKIKAAKSYTPLTAIIEPGYEPSWPTYTTKTANHLISIFVGNGYQLLQKPYTVIGDSEEFISTSSAPYCSNKIPENALGIYCGMIQAGYGYFLLGLQEGTKFSSGAVLSPTQRSQVSLYVARDVAIMYELQAQYGTAKYNGSKNQIPAWIRQGFVELFAALALADTSGTNKNYYEVLTSLNSIEKFPKALCTKTLQDFESKNRNWETFCASAQNLYATELLVARHGGLKTLFKFVELYGISDDWTSAFKTAFGISREDFYTEWYDYLNIPMNARPALTPAAPAAHY